MISSIGKIDQRMLATIHRHGMFKAGDVAGVAVSGGADSVALLLLMQELRETLGIRLLVLHFNHELRGAESDEDERFVEELARTLGMEFFAARENVAARAREAGSNLEDAARKYRYGFFGRLVSEGRITRVCVGHTADDQAETVLAKIIRGTGPAGLAGIYPVAGHVVRPQIEIRRAELREFLRGRSQSWREDSSNLDETRLRARIRRRLLPALEEDFQPAIVSHLGKLANLAREDESFWTALAEERFRELVRREGDTFSIVIQDLLMPLDLSAETNNEPRVLAPVTTRIIRRILAELRGDRLGFTNRHIEDVIHLATGSTSGHQIHLPHEIVVEREFEELRFGRRELRRAKKAPLTPSNDSEYQWTILLDDVKEKGVDIPEIGRRIRLKVIDWPALPRDTYDDAVFADWSCIREPLVVRNWHPGDAIRPQGRLRARKLKQLFRERRIGLRERRCWPVLTSAGELVWAKGFPVAQRFLTGEETRKVLVICEEPL